MKSALEITDRRICPSCGGRRFVGPWLCETCRGDGSIIVEPKTFPIFTRVTVALIFIFSLLAIGFLIAGRQ